MKKTQLYLEEDLYKALRQRAAAMGKSMAQVVREALTAYLGWDGHKPQEPVVVEAEKEQAEEAWCLEDDPLYQIIGMASSGVGDLAERHDYYLYVEDKD